MREKLLKLFNKKNKWTLEELRKEMVTDSSSKLVSLMKTLNSLVAERKLINNHACYFPVKDEDVVGKVKDISKFEISVSNPEKKVYVEKKYAQNVFVEDEVLAVKEKGVWKVKHIFAHNIYRITGYFIKLKGRLVFHSDIDFHRDFEITNLNQFKINVNDRVVVKVIKYDNPMLVEIEKVIGNNKEKGVDITALLMKNNIRMEFNKKVEEEIRNLPAKVTSREIKSRRDLRFLQTVTIDGEDAKDFDDAISITENENGYSLYVHIADVSYYVKEGSSIDKEAYARGTSIYVCDRVVPMLPVELSNGICSLNESVERNTITCQMEINNQGIIESYLIYPSVIFSDRRCTYNKVNECLNGNEAAIEEYASLQKMIVTMYDCAKLLEKQANKRGSIEFVSVEPIIELNKKGKAINVTLRESGESEQIIEQFMIAANMCVANYMDDNNIPSMYRVHMEPDYEDLLKLKNICANFNIDVTIEEITPSIIQRLLDSIEDESVYVAISNVALRTMQKARYSNECLGHFGLSLAQYCHFTAPIRRYSDLVVHRMLRKYLFDNFQGNKEKDYSKIERQALQMSNKEMEAIIVEREINDYKIAEYMESFIGDVFEGIIVSVLEFGFFVQLDNSAEGLVAARTLFGYYEYEEKTMSLIGPRRTYTIGNRVKVRVTDVNVSKGQIGFEIV
ncbi:MAG: ribonuclease R [Bacillota bacterium]|jgi:ribonuclease R|nr:ribonuclease R [Bacillota bacterium]NLL26248.1 ribonuclease R [Erysipelotrichia bacterium]